MLSLWVSLNLDTVTHSTVPGWYLCGRIGLYNGKPTYMSVFRLHHILELNICVIAYLFVKYNVNS
jgi:hypothetical protein